MENNYVSPTRAFFGNRIVRVFLAIDVVVILAIIGVIIWNNLKKVSVINLNVAPIDATISINGNTDYENGMYSVIPGTYEIVISHEGLESKTFTIDLAPGYVATLATFLKASDGDFNFYKLKNNYRSYLKLKEIASAENNITTDADSSAEYFIDNYEHLMSILDVLPIKGYVYADPRVGSSTAGFAIRNGISMEECEEIACLLVNYYGTDFQDSVMKKIREAGYTPEDYQIIYKEYDN